MDVLYNVSKQIKAKAVNLADGVGGTELEKKVKAATSNEHYPTPLSQLQEIANATHDYSSCREIMPLVWKRIGESKEYWRIVYKALVLLRELIRFGSERVIDETRDHMFQLRQLENFRYQEDGKERGNGIREVSLEIMDLVHDQRKLQQVREEAQRNRSKYTSQSSSGGGSSYSNSSWQSGSSYDEGPTGKYAGFGGGSDSYSSRGSSSYDEPQKPKKKSSSHDDDNGDDPYGESSSKKSKEEKKKKKSKDRSPSPSPSPNSGDPANGDEEDEKAAKKKKKASKKAKEAAEAALANAPKVTGGKLAPPPAEAPDLFDPRATATSSSGGDAFTDFQSNTGGDSGFEAFTSAAPVAASKPTNTLDALFDFDGAPPARPAATATQSVTNNNDFGFGAFNSSSNSSFTQSSKSSSNDWDAFASSTSSTGTRSNASASSGFDLLSSIPSASPSSSSSRGQQSQQSDVFEAFQTSKPSSSTANSSQPKKSTPSDAWQTDLVKLDLGSSKPAPVQGTQVHIPGPKSADPFSHLIPNQQRPIMPQQSQQPGGMRPGGMGMPMQGGPIMANQIGMGMGMGMGGMQQQQQQGSGMMGMGMGMQGGFGGMPQGGMGMQGGMNQAGFGFPQKKPNHDIFF